MTLPTGWVLVINVALWVVYAIPAYAPGPGAGESREDVCLASMTAGLSSGAFAAAPAR